MGKKLIAFLLCMAVLLPLLGGFGSLAYADETTPVTEAPTEAPTDAPADYSGNVGKYATFNVAETGYFDFSDAPAGEPLVFTPEDIPAELTVVITDWYVGDGEDIWYQFEAAPDNTLPEALTGLNWVMDGYVGDDGWALVKFDAPDDGSGDDSGDDTAHTDLTQTTEQGIGVSVSGSLPQGTSLSATDVTVDPAEYGIDDASSILAALDIRLLDADGADYQPSADGVQVQVTIEAAKMGLADGAIVRVHHNHEGTITVFEPYVVIGGKLTFWTDRFSIYLVENIRVENKSIEIAEGSTYTMKIGEKAVFWGDYGGNRAVWKVENESQAINYNVIGKNDPGNNYAAQWAQWIEIEAKRVGTTQVYFRVNDTPHAFTIKVISPSGLYIKGQAAENGCLVPAWSEGATVDLSRVRYTWTRDDGQAVRLEALQDDGSVNVSIDRGGATNNADGTVKTITYTVTATDLDGKELGKASYEVLYGNEILNPSFEKPGGFGSGHTTFYNGYPGLFWKTTAPGDGGHLAKDIEVGNVNGNPYGIMSADGSYFVELNAEEFGALYQDILTTPGASLTWSFNHAKRVNSGGGGRDSVDSMYVIVAATDYAQKIVSKVNIDAMLDEAVRQAAEQGVKIPNNDSDAYSEGFEFTFTNSANQTGTYRIWSSKVKYSSNADEQWHTISGTYKVPEGQYLTRLFFASDTNDTNSANSTLGNMIDAVNAGEFMSYTVEYYIGAELQSDHTESGTNSAYEQVKLENLDSYLQKYQFPFEILINGRPYPGTVENLKTGLLLTDYGTKTGESTDEKYDDYGIVLKIVFQDPNIRVTKVVEIEGWEDMSVADRKALLDAGIFAEFALVNGSTTEHTTRVTITQLTDDGKLTAAASFTTVSEDDFGKTFTVKETNQTNIPNYRVETTIDPGTVGVTQKEGDRIKNVTVTNRYIRNVGNLTIKKDVLNPGKYQDIPADDAFTFVVSGAALSKSSYMVSISNGADQEYDVTDGKLTIELKAGQWAVIKDLDLKEYKVEEIPKAYYTLTSKTGDTGTIVKTNTAYAGFENTYLPVGDLRVEKQVDVGTNSHVQIDADKEFEFTLTLGTFTSTLTGPYACTINSRLDDSVISSGTLALSTDYKLTFKLKHNQYIVIQDLPVTTFTLMETAAGTGYLDPYYYFSDQGPEDACATSIIKGDTALVQCYNPVDISNGDLRITKKVTSTDSDAVIPKQAFQFTVVLRNLSEADYTYDVVYSCDSTKGTLNGNTYTLKGETTGYTLPTTVTAEEALGDYIFTLTLYDGLTATIQDIPPCGYFVSEMDYSAQKFAASWEGDTVGYIGGVKTGDSNPLASVTCTNTYGVQTGSLNITKFVTKAYERDIVPASTFTFTIQPADTSVALVDGEYDIEIDTVEGTATCEDGVITVSIPFTADELKDLKLGDSKNKVLTIKGLPFGTYQVVENTDTDFVQSATTQTGNVSGTPGAVSFTNKYKQYLGEITIIKSVTGTSSTEPVLVKITGTNGLEMIVPVSPGTPVTIYDLPLDVTYTVTELTDWSWRYEPSGSKEATAELTMASPETEVRFVNTFEENQWLSDTDVEPNEFKPKSD